jgi:hypothetical protein
VLGYFHDRILLTASPCCNQFHIEGTNSGNRLGSKSWTGKICLIFQAIKIPMAWLAIGVHNFELSG